MFSRCSGNWMLLEYWNILECLCWFECFWIFLNTLESNENFGICWKYFGIYRHNLEFPGIFWNTSEFTEHFEIYWNIMEKFGPFWKSKKCVHLGLDIVEFWAVGTLDASEFRRYRVSSAQINLALKFRMNFMILIKFSVKVAMWGCSFGYLGSKQFSLASFWCEIAQKQGKLTKKSRL